MSIPVPGTPAGARPAGPPAGRYGPAPRPGARRRRTIALWAVGAAGVALAVWLGLGQASAPVTWQDVGFVISGDDSVEVVFDVSRIDPSVEVECRVQALNEQYGQVGVLSVEVPPGTERTERVRVVVATSERAVTGLVDVCQVP